MAPSAGYREYFPNAPRVARDRASERERDRYSKSTDTSENRQRTATPAHRDVKHDSSVSETARPLNQDTSTDSSQGDLLNGVGSDSSHASTSSSIFSSHNGVTALNVVAHSSNDTPLTAAGSPAYNNNHNINATQPSKENLATASKSAGQSDSTSLTAAMKSSATPPGVIKRLPARDPNRPIQGMKSSLYDASLDRTLSSSSSERRNAKPQYKHFGSVREPILHYTISAVKGGRHLILV
jgi:[histone H3]-lysine4 N-trimethyltransferase SETD1